MKARLLKELSIHYNVPITVMLHYIPPYWAVDGDYKGNLTEDSAPIVREFDNLRLHG